MPLTTIVQQKSFSSDGTGTAFDAPLDTAVVQGDTIIVMIAGWGAVPNNVSDSNGNTYAIAVACPNLGTDGSKVYFWWARDAQGGATVHIEAPASTTGAYAVQIFELAGSWLPLPTTSVNNVDGFAAAISQNSVGSSANLEIVTDAPPAPAANYTGKPIQLFFGSFDNAEVSDPFVANWTFLQSTATTYGTGSGGTAQSGTTDGTAGTYTLGCSWPDLLADQPGFVGEAPLFGWGVSIAAIAFYQDTTDSSSGGTGGIDVVTDLCERAGVPFAQIDTSLLLVSGNIQPTNVVKGYLLNQAISAAQAIKVLCDAYFFDLCESDGILKSVPRGLPPVFSIPEYALGLQSDKCKLTPQIIDPQTLPKRVTVTYNDPALNYQQQKQEYLRNSRLIPTHQQVKLDFPLTLDPDFARQLAQKACLLAYQERRSYDIKLWRPEDLRIDATDVGEFTYEGVVYRMRVDEETLGQGFVLNIKGPSQDARLYISTAQGGTSYTPPPSTTPVTAFTTLFLFDIPLLDDTYSAPGNTGLFAAMTSQVTGWAGAELDYSSDDVSFLKLAQSTSPVTYGFAQNALGVPPTPWTWDYVNTLTLKMSEGVLAGDTEINVLNGANQLVMGNGEIIHFQNVTTNGDGTVTLSKLLRGRRGTELSCGTHVAGEVVVAPLSGIVHAVEPLAVRGVLRYYRAVTTGQDPSTVPTQQNTNTATDLKPYAPCQIQGARDGSNNLTLAWTRRTRVGGEWVNGTGTVPLSEDTESYDIDIVSGITVLRTITGVFSPTTIYTAAQQTADGLTPGNPVSINVYQNSGQVARGFPGSATV